MLSTSGPECGRWLRIPLALIVALVALLSTAQPTAAVSPNIVISQIYGGGGNSGAPYTHDFIELYNRGDAAASLAGWSLQYASATGTGNFGANTGQSTELPAVTLAPGQYFLVQEAGGSTGVALPTPDLVDPTPINLSATGGKVALVITTASLGCNGGSAPCSPAALAQIVDLVGFGTANFYEDEGTAAPAPSNTTAILRAGNGATDTDNNAADFAAGAPNPRTSTPIATDPSGAGLAIPSSVSDGGSALLTVDVTPGDNPPSSALVVTADLTGIGGNATQAFSDDGMNGDVTANDLIFSYRVTVPVGTSAGTKTLPATIVDGEGRDVSANILLAVTSGADCSVAYTRIFEVQGSGTTSPAVDQARTIQGVVTGDFQTSAELSGFFLQDRTGDGNRLTSDGIFVFIPSANMFSNVNVAAGDVVRVSGTVKEFNTLTELDTVTSIQTCGTASVAPVAVSLPEQTNGDLERYEGMLVKFGQRLTVGQNFFQGRYGQVTLAPERLIQPTNRYIPGSPAAVASTDRNARSLIVLDDGRSSQNPAPIPYIGQDNTLRAGDIVNGVTGVIDFGPINSNTAIRDYRVHPTRPVDITRANPRTAAPKPVGGNARVASFNVLNYFNGNGAGGGFPTSRGASSPVEFERQRIKIIGAIKAIDPDVAGLMEMENDGTGTTSAIQDLVNGLNAATSAGRYSFVAEPFPGTDEIKVAVIYQPGRVTPVGAAVNDTNPVHNRPPLAQTFRHNATGQVFTAIVNHFKSKGCDDEATGGDADLGDGQSCYNATRVAQAEALVAFITARQAAAGDDDVLVIGDLNAYGLEDPVRVLTSAGLVNEIARFIGGSAYSYIFDGMSGYLDHALATTTMNYQVAGVTEWHINADEPSVIDYNTEFKPQDLYAPTPYRASDHDPVVIGLNLARRNTPPVALPQAVRTAEETAVQITLKATDVNGNPLTYQVVDGPRHGTLSGTAPYLTYTPATNFYGLDYVAFRANDGQANSNVGIVVIAVTPVNDPPAARDDTATTTKNKTVRVNVLRNDSDPDRDRLRVTGASGAKPGARLSVERDGTIAYRPPSGFVGTDSFTYAISDGNGGTASATVVVTVKR